MSDEPTQSPAPESGSQVSDSWKEVGRQLGALGKSFAEAITVAWNNPSTQKLVQEVKTGLETMASEVGAAISKASSSPEAQKLKAEAVKAAQSARTAGEQTAQEVRPQLLNALRSLNDEMQKLIDKLEADPGASTYQEPPDTEA
jgi:gas vesicle protein